MSILLRVGLQIWDVACFAKDLVPNHGFLEEVKNLVNVDIAQFFTE
jgi:hypothetical protein